MEQKSRPISILLGLGLAGFATRVHKVFLPADEEMHLVGDLVAAALLGGFVAWICWKDRASFPLRQSRIALLFLLFAMWIGGGLLFSLNPLFGAQKAAMLLLVSGMGMVVALVVASDPNALIAYLWGHLGVGLIFMLAVIFAYSQYGQLGADYVTVAKNVGVACVVLTCAAMTMKLRWPVLLAIGVVTLVAWAALIAMYSRASIAFTFASIAITAGVIRLRKGGALSLLILVFGLLLPLIAIVTVCLLFPVVEQGLRYRTEIVIDSAYERLKLADPVGNVWGGERFSPAEGVRNSWWSRLIGAGTGSYRFRTFTPDVRDEIYRYPHNLLVEILYENGIVGFLLLSCVLGLGAREWFRLAGAARHSAVPTFFAASVCGLSLCFFLYTTTRGHCGDQTAFFTLLGLMAGQLRAVSTAQERRK